MMRLSYKNGVPVVSTLPEGGYTVVYPFVYPKRGE